MPGEKPLDAEKRTNNKLDPHDKGRVTLVGGECSHHYSIPTLLNVKKDSFKRKMCIKCGMGYKLKNFFPNCSHSIRLPEEFEMNGLSKSLKWRDISSHELCICIIYLLNMPLRGHLYLKLPLP